MALPPVSQYCTDCCAVLFTKENEPLFKQALLSLLCSIAGASISQDVSNGYLDVLPDPGVLVFGADPTRTFHSYKNMSDVDMVITLGAVANLSQPKLLTPGQEWIAPASYKGPVSAIHGGVGVKILEYIQV